MSEDSVPLLSDFEKWLPEIPLLNQFSSRKKWEKTAWDSFTDSIAAIKDRKAASQLLKVLLSDSERKDILYRVACLDRLRSRSRFSAISKELLLSPQTISAIKKSFTEGAYRSSRARGHKKRPSQGSLLPPLRQRYPNRRAPYGRRKF